ncbi:MAG: Type 1 glutamine amidotransferase-like domain-containing protein, partial [Deltaproteobacteria bacterium]|nr:Type 1 glutamine amidotransferase-like domain-containing protein [Deltaproteobacteria bacterium]
MGILLLEGGCEFQGKMAEPDRKALALAGGEKAGIVIIPTAAAPDHNHERAGSNALRWFGGLGAKNVLLLPIIDTASANDPEFSSQLNRADFIYMLGGFPGYLDNTLKESRCLAAIRGAYQRGAVLAGISAGAMVLCEQYFDPADSQLKNGFGFQKNVILIPHHDTFGSAWRDQYLDNIQ